MKKYLAILLAMFMLAGCAQAPITDTTEINSQDSEKTQANQGQNEDQIQNEDQTQSETFTYQSEHGDIELPTDPERIVVLDASAAGAVLLFDGSVVGHEQWTGHNALFQDRLKNSTEVATDNLEQILALNPDLIVTSPSNENFEELSQIAPTVSFTYGRLNYLDTIIEYGKMLNKEEKAKQWVERYQAKAKIAGEAIKSKYGEDVSISVIEAYGDEMYLYGDNWGRGTQVVYQEMGLRMTDPVKKVALTDGYYSISAEVVQDYQADLMILSQFEGSNTAFMETETWNNIKAVKNNQVLMVEGESFYMTGPITLEYQLETIESFFTK